MTMQSLGIRRGEFYLYFSTKGKFQEVKILLIEL